MVSPSVIKGVRDYLGKLNSSGVPTSFGILFGSQVTNKADEWSDIDLIVVSSVFDGEIKREMINILWRIAAHTDSRIEPIPCGEKQWKEGDSSPLVDIARMEGLRIDVN